MGYVTEQWQRDPGAVHGQWVEVWTGNGFVLMAAKFIDLMRQGWPVRVTWRV